MHIIYIGYKYKCSININKTSVLFIIIDDDDDDDSSSSIL